MTISPPRCGTKPCSRKTAPSIRRTSSDNGFVTDASDWVLSGPHFFLANPFNKTPRRVCTANSHYDPIDLEAIPDDYLPRTNYHPMADRAEYLRRTPTCKLGGASGKTGTKPVTEYFRFVHPRDDRAGIRANPDHDSGAYSGVAWCTRYMGRAFNSAFTDIRLISWHSANSVTSWH